MNGEVLEFIQIDGYSFLFLDAIIAREWRFWRYTEVFWRIWVNLPKPSLPTIWDHHFFYKHRLKKIYWKNSMSKTYCIHLKRAMNVDIDLFGKLYQGQWKWPYIWEISLTYQNVLGWIFTTTLFKRTFCWSLIHVSESLHMSTLDSQCTAVASCYAQQMSLWNKEISAKIL